MFFVFRACKSALHFKIWESVDAETELITSQMYFEGDESYNPASHFGPVISVDESGLSEPVFAV